MKNRHEGPTLFEKFQIKARFGMIDFATPSEYKDPTIPQMVWKESVRMINLIVYGEPLPPHQFSSVYSIITDRLGSQEYNPPSVDTFFIPRNEDISRFLLYAAGDFSIDQYGSVPKEEKEEIGKREFYLAISSLYLPKKKRVPFTRFDFIGISPEEIRIERGLLMKLPFDSSTKRFDLQGISYLYRMITRDSVNKEPQRFEVDSNEKRINVLIEGKWFIFYFVGEEEGNYIFFSRLPEASSGDKEPPVNEKEDLSFSTNPQLVGV